MALSHWTPETLLQEAKRLAQAGDLETARRLLGEVLRSAPHDLEGWTLGAQLAAKPSEESYCLKRVLQIDPAQTWAKTRLDELLKMQTGKLAVPSATPVVLEDVAIQTLEPPSPVSPPPVPPESVPPPEEPAGDAEPASPALFTPPPPVPMPASPSEAPAPTRDSRRRRRTDPMFVFLCIMLALFSGIFGLTVVALLSRLSSRTPTPIALTSVPPGTTAPQPPAVAEDCQALITRALQAAESNCSRLGPNQVCYGNTQLVAQLAPGATRPFQARGDIVGVDQLRRISASPLDVMTKDWGVAIFKLLANVPRSLPGQNVTFIVFGNTALDNASGDLQAFYFSSQLGHVTCERLASDGILIHMPDGAGLTFSANGTAITLLGTAELKAQPNKDMTVSVSSGSASVTAAGQTQYFGAGQEVKVPLGGAGGLAPAGPPSAPSDVAAGTSATCAMLGVNCKPGDVQRVDPTQAAIAIAQAVATSPAGLTGTPGLSTPKPGLLTPTPVRTGARTPTQTLTPARELTSSAVPSASAPSRTKTATITGTLSPQPSTPTPSLTGVASPTTTRVPSAASTGTIPPSPTATATVAPSDTSTATTVPTDTPTSTPTATSAPVCQLTAGNMGAGGTVLTVRLQNGSSTPASITSMTLGWPDDPPQQKITEIRLGGAVIDNSNYNNPPSNIPVGGNWLVGQPADRQLPAVSEKDLEFVFQILLPQQGYNLTVNFDNGCVVSASR